MPDEAFLDSFRKRYALLQQKLAEAQSKKEEEEDALPSQAERLARARRNRLKMPELKDLRQQLTSKAVEHGHLPASMGTSGEWAKFLPKEDDPGGEVKVANAAEAAGLPTVAAAQLAQMSAKREQQRQQHREQLSQLNEQAEQMKAALHGTRAPDAGSGMPGGWERQAGRLRQLQEEQGQVAADLQNLKGSDSRNDRKDRTQVPKGSPEMKGKGQRKGKAYGKWGPGKGYGDYSGGAENYGGLGNVPEYQSGQEQVPDWYWNGWYNQYQPWMQAPPQRGHRHGRRNMQPRGMGQPVGSPIQSMADYRSPAEMQAINGMNAVLQRVRGKMAVPARATEDVQPQTKAGAWGAAANEDAPAEAPATSGTAAGSATGTASAGVAPAAEEGRRESAASSAADGKEKKEKKDKKEKEKDADSKKGSKEKKKEKEDEEVGKTGSRAQKSWFGGK